MPTDLHDLKIDRNRKREPAASKWATRWIIAGVCVLVLLGLGRVVYNTLATTPQVQTVRVSAPSVGSDPGTVVLNATGYIVAHHEIEVASKVVGKVDWIGVEK